MHPSQSEILSLVFAGNQLSVFYRMGMAESLTLMSRRGSEVDFTIVSEDEESPFIDCRPKLNPLNPEMRHYRAILAYANGKCLLSNEIWCCFP